MGFGTQRVLGGRSSLVQDRRDWGPTKVGLLVEFLWEGLHFLCKGRGAKHLGSLKSLGTVCSSREQQKRKLLEKS